jgi:hypothetical protein
MDMHHLVNTARGVEYFVERHELTLFLPEEYAQAFQAAGLESDVDPYGLIGRGLCLGRRPIDEAGHEGRGSAVGRDSSLRDPIRNVPAT